MVPAFLEQYIPVIRSVLLVLVVLPLTMRVSSWTEKRLSARYSLQAGMVIGKTIRYSAIGLVVATLMHELGFQIGPLLGAAGIAGVVIGVGSQTSISNIVSGLFLIMEKPFVVGDVLKFQEVVGTVLSVDLLSVKIRTPANQYVRIPNEALVKTTFTNLTRFPTRRIDIPVIVRPEDDPDTVKQLVLEVMSNNKILPEPAAGCVGERLLPHGLELLFSCWCRQEVFGEVQTALLTNVHTALGANKLVQGQPVLIPR